MRIPECQNFRFKFLLLAFLLGVGLTFMSCSSQSKEKHLARGEEYLQKRKYTEAVMEFRAVADIDKNSAEAHWGLARAFENLGQFYETIGELQQVIDLKPENLEAKIKLGNYYLLTEPPQTFETEKILEDVFARDANFIEAHILKASLFAAQKKSEKEVLDVLNHAVALDPNRVETYMSLARYFMQTDNAADAERAINKGVSVNPNRALGYLEYGRFLGYAARGAEAEAQFRRAIEIEPKNIEAREAIAEFFFNSRELAKAEQSYKELVSIQENSPEARIQLADFYAAVNQDDEAVRVFNEILTDTPEYVRARYRLGEIYLERRETERVGEQVEELLKLNEADAEALMLRARVRLQENQPDEAVKDLEDVLKKQPSQKNALFFMTQARLALGQIDQARAFIGDLEKYHPNYLRTRLLKIQAGFASGEPETALRESNALLEAVERAQPSAETSAVQLEDLLARALTARGLANLELGKLAEARADLQQVQKRSPNSAAAAVNLAKVFAAENNLPEAARLYNDALAKDGKNFDALNGLVGVLTVQNQFAEAHAQIDKAIRENIGQKSASAALRYLKSDVFTAEKNPAAAEGELKASIETDDQYLPAYSAYAALLIARSQIDEGVAQYKKIVEKKPSAAVYTLLGMLEEARNNSAEVEKNYRKALEIEPDAPVAANNLAWFIAAGNSANQGNLDEALQLAQKTVNKHPNVAGYYDTLGWVYYKKQLYSPAIEHLKKAIALDESEAVRTNKPVNPAYRMRLGTALASAGDKFSARRELEISLQNAGGLSQREMQDAKNLLASL
ncbi:MAG TPA: tetratricopeptide repeat protein [Pyrinomonadaceae bacterium]|nr:tetratricopeptide repeat protein [Pyrinomonadaceae bacterium]